MKLTYEELEAEIAFLKVEVAELKLALTGRTVSCVFCNNSAKERDEAIKERDEARATVAEMRDDISIWDVQIGDKVHYAYRIPDSQLDKSTPMPPHEFREATQQDVDRLMSNPIIRDMKWKSVDDRKDAEK